MVPFGAPSSPVTAPLTRTASPSLSAMFSTQPPPHSLVNSNASTGPTPPAATLVPPPPLFLMPTQPMPTLQRNKAVVCKNFLDGRCTTMRDECPYLHAQLDEQRPVPERTCRYFSQGACLRGTCPFFHGSQSELKSLIRSHGQSGKYTLRDLNLAVLEPPLTPNAAMQHTPQQYHHTNGFPGPHFGGAPTMVLSPPQPQQHQQHQYPLFHAGTIPQISTTDLSIGQTFMSMQPVSGGQTASSAAPTISPSAQPVTNTNLLSLQQQYAYYGKHRSPQQQSLSRQGSSLSRASSNLSAVSSARRGDAHNLEGSMSLHDGDGGDGASLTSLLKFPLNLGEPMSSSSTPVPANHSNAAAAQSLGGSHGGGDGSTCTPGGFGQQASGGSFGAASVGGAGGGFPFLPAPTMMISPASSSSSMLHLHNPSSGNYNISSASSFGGRGTGHSHPRQGTMPTPQGQGHQDPYHLASSSPQPMLVPCFVLPGGSGGGTPVHHGLTAVQLQQHQHDLFSQQAGAQYVMHLPQQQQQQPPVLLWMTPPQLQPHAAAPMPMMPMVSSPSTEANGSAFAIEGGGTNGSAFGWP